MTKEISYWMIALKNGGGDLTSYQTVDPLTPPSFSEENPNTPFYRFRHKLHVCSTSCFISEHLVS